jgi:hypothetical protein
MHPQFTAIIAEERLARRRYEADRERLIRESRREKFRPRPLAKLRLTGLESVVTTIFHRALRIP